MRISTAQSIIADAEAEAVSILVVEDEAIIAADLKDRLESMGFAVTSCVQTGAQALLAVQEQRPDLVLMDIRLRGPIDGIETARRLQSRNDVPVVYVTSHADTATLTRAVATNPHGYIVKPFHDAELRVGINIAMSHHRTEHSLLDTQTDLQKKMNHLDEFVSQVSHEMRTPITAMEGALGLLTAGAVGELPKDMQSLTDAAYRNAQRLGHLVSDILDNSKIEAGHFDCDLQPLCLNDLIVQCVEEIAPYAQRFGVELSLIEATQSMRVLGDRDRLKQVLANLISNAVKHSPSAATVLVELQPHEQFVRVTVTDWGTGIPSEFKPHIFKKFAQADADKKAGMGLGLTISKAIVEQHGGAIGFSTRQGVGEPACTAFWFDLPLQ